MQPAHVSLWLRDVPTVHVAHSGDAGTLSTSTEADTTLLAKTANEGNAMARAVFVN
jgi:hypothetical protein